jgi:catechol 2,3-dioxygenase-like lactoylglutathione lyase family enzyme
MKLNHLDLQVSDVPAARRFFETYFGFRCPHAREGLVILEDEAGFVLAVSNLSQASVPHYPEDFHVGFIVERVEQVKEIYDRLQKAGVSMKLDLQQMGPHLTFLCYAPDAIPVQVSAPVGS